MRAYLAQVSEKRFEKKRLGLGVPTLRLRFQGSLAGWYGGRHADTDHGWSGCVPVLAGGRFRRAGTLAGGE